MHDRIENEREFHDNWAESEQLDDIDVVLANEVCTAPEIRHIMKSLGDIRGKSLLDVGCGLGEASVYFAMKGAEVTAMDLSPGMLQAAQSLAERNSVTLKTHQASAEDVFLKPDQMFDIIYAGNLLHHVDLEETIQRLTPHLRDGGVFVSWDPLAYNPAINVYRRMATEVRTPDEHPLTLSDLRRVRRSFGSVDFKFFWLTTLVVFGAMFLFQRRDPNKERYWKAVLKEADRWAPIYRPLEALDRVLLALFPPLRLLCWNVVIIARK